MRNSVAGLLMAVCLTNAPLHAMQLTTLSVSSPVTSTVTSPVPTLPIESPTDSTTRRPFLKRHAVLTVSAIGVVSTLALRPLDEPILRRLRRPDVQSSLPLRNTADAFNYIGGPGFVIASAAMVGGGYLTHHSTLTQIGVRTTEAIVINAVAVTLLKDLFGRQRPFVDESNASVWAFGRGFSTGGRSSFPSGHASSSFAFATAATLALHTRKSRATRYVAPLLFGAATMVGAARVYGAHHWPSDIAAGALAGTVSGWVVNRRDLEVTPTGVRWRF